MEKIANDAEYMETSHFILSRRGLGVGLDRGWHTGFRGSLRVWRRQGNNRTYNVDHVSLTEHCLPDLVELRFFTIFAFFTIFTFLASFAFLAFFTNFA